MVSGGFYTSSYLLQLLCGANHPQYRFHRFSVSLVSRGALYMKPIMVVSKYPPCPCLSESEKIVNAGNDTCHFYKPRKELRKRANPARLRTTNYNGSPGRS